MTTIATSTAVSASGYGNQRKVDRCQNGVLWTHWWDGTATTTTSMRFAYSTDNGATWTDSNANAFGFAGTGTTYTPNASFFIDLDDNIHVVYNDRHDGFIYYRRGTPNAGRTAWTWSSAFTVSNVDPSETNYPDLVAFRDPASSGWFVAIVVSGAGGGGVSRVLYERLSVSSGGVVASAGGDGLTAQSGMFELGPNYSTAAATFPSIDFNHTGDGKTVAGSTPHLYVGWTAGATGAGKGVRFRKATYSGGSWTWGTEREIDNTRYVIDSRWLLCLFDGTRVVLACWLVGTDLVLYERDVADTTTTTRVLLSSAAADSTLYFGSASHDGAGNVHVFGRNNDEAAGTFDLVYRKWTRASATLGPEVVVDSGVGSPYVSAKRGYSNNRIEFIYTDGTASPYNVVYDSVLLNVAPNAPTLVSPVGGVSIDLALSNRLSWTFSDADTGDSQSKFDLRYRETGVAQNEIQTVTISGSPTGGTFTLTYSGQTTAAIAYNATAATVQAALEALSNIAVGDVAVSGGPLPGTAVTVTFQGALGSTNVAAMTATSSLTGGTTPAVAVATTQQGVPVPSWTGITGVTPNNFYDLPAATLTAGDYEWQVRTYDAQGLVGPYSSSSFFTAAVVSNDITITAPTNGATIPTETFTVTWSTPTQTHYQLRVVADLAGVPDPATVIYDTGEIASSSARSRQVSYPDNGVTRHTQVRKKQDGLWSDWASVSNPVSYTIPAQPELTVYEGLVAGALSVQASHPAPTGDQPTVVSVDVYRREIGDSGPGIRIAAGIAPTAIYDDFFVASGVEYAYAVKANGDNQTSALSDWSEDAAVLAGSYGGAYS